MALKINLENDEVQRKHVIDTIEKRESLNIQDENGNTVYLSKNESGYWRSGIRGPYEEADDSYFKGLFVIFG
jgi:hypothetical protein